MDFQKKKTRYKSKSRCNSFCDKYKKRKKLLLNQSFTFPADKSSGISGSIEQKSRRFSYPDVVRMTNNFERIIGKGGFGTVYYGCFDDIQVAVKMLSASSIQGFKQFQTEVWSIQCNLLLI